ncbi:hypothetical protein MMC31_007579 [Peltigera leucophlebia]|nr:hypothetical protein [Peltigera leucophlebia]
MQELITWTADTEPTPYIEWSIPRVKKQQYIDLVERLALKACPPSIKTISIRTAHVYVHLWQGKERHPTFYSKFKITGVTWGPEPTNIPSTPDPRFCKSATSNQSFLAKLEEAKSETVAREVREPHDQNQMSKDEIEEPKTALNEQFLKSAAQLDSSYASRASANARPGNG